MEKRYLALSLALVLSLAIFLGHKEEVFADELEVARLDANGQGLIRELECELFEQKIKMAKESILSDLKKGIITEARAREELDYIDYLEDNFERGILPREIPAEKYKNSQNTYDSQGYNYGRFNNYSNDHPGHHLDRNHRNHNKQLLNKNAGYNVNRHHNGGCRRY